MTDTLWFKFPDDSAATLVFDDAEMKKFDAVFDVANPQSPWSRALELLSFPCHLEQHAAQDNKLIYWVNGAPYFNWSAMTHVIGGGAIKVLRKDGGGYAFHVSYAPRDLWHLFAGQWKTVKFLQKKIGNEDALAESIALGIVLQSMILRLGKDAEMNLAKWLSGAVEVPPRYKKTVAQLQAVQMRRTALSPAWKNILPNAPEQTKTLPTYFWNNPLSRNTGEGGAHASHGRVRESSAANADLSSMQQSPPSPQPSPVLRERKYWAGLPVCSGKITGRAIVIKSVKDTIIEKSDMPLILIFKRARPESVELYPQAAAVVFAEGGILAHACVVAREMNLPSVTGLGIDFYDIMLSHNGAVVTVDGSAGTVKIV